MMPAFYFPSVCRLSGVSNMLSCCLDPFSSALCSCLTVDEDPIGAFLEPCIRRPTKGIVRNCQGRLVYCCDDVWILLRDFVGGPCCLKLLLHLPMSNRHLGL